MNIIINNIKVHIDFDETKIFDEARKKFNINEEDIVKSKIIKRAIDCREFNIFLIFSIYFELKDKKEYKDLVLNNDITLFELKETLEVKKLFNKDRPVIIGFGPSGMLCALILARANLNPIIIEQGKKIEERVLDVENIYEKKILDPYSNILFGEGGAGTFSDGKLTTGVKSEYIRFVLTELIKFGANENIYYDNKPHIGTDIIRKVAINIRQEIENLGGTFYFSHQFVNFQKNNTVFTINVKDLINNKEFNLSSENLVLAVGHSLRENYELLLSKNVELLPKNFSIGVRIEHLKETIDKIQFKRNYKHPKLKFGDYKLSVKVGDKRSLYTFCMCPGGEVVLSSNKANQINVNGMSYNKRDLVNSNSALLVNVDVQDYYKNSALDGINFIEKYERKTFDISNSLKVPVQRVIDFKKNVLTKRVVEVIPSCKTGYVFKNFKDFLPDFVYDTLKKGIPLLNRRMPGFDVDNAILVGIETRSSSPITIKRNDNYQTNISSLYAIGEGSGYSGGLMSSFIDGIKTALKIIELT